MGNQHTKEKTTQEHDSKTSAEYVLREELFHKRFATKLNKPEGKESIPKLIKTYHSSPKERPKVIKEIWQRTRTDNKPLKRELVANDVVPLLLQAINEPDVSKEHVLRAIKNLVAEDDQNKLLFTKNGAVSILIELLKKKSPEDDKLYAVSAIGNMVNTPEISSKFVESGLLLHLVPMFTENPKSDIILDALVNVSKSKEVKLLMVNLGIMEPILSSFSEMTRSRVLLLSLSFGEQETIDKIKQTTIVNTLLQFLTTNPNDSLAILCLANLIGKDETNKQFLQGNQNLMLKMKSLLEAEISHPSQDKVYTLLELLQTVENLAINDENKKRFVDVGILSPIKTLLLSKPDKLDEEKKKCLSIICQLAFEEKNRQKIREMITIEDVKTFQLSEDLELVKLAKEFLFQFKQIKLFPSRRTKPSKGGGHIMLSYNWDHQKQVFEIRNFLKTNGFTNIWIDVERMGDDLFESMSSAIDEAKVVLIFVTRKYKESISCHREATYAVKKNKHIIPLMIEKGYTPTGWLEFIMSSLLYIDFRKENEKKSSLNTLLYRLGKVFDTCDHLPTIEGPHTPLTLESPSRNSMPCEPKVITIRKWQEKTGGVKIQVPSSIDQLLSKGGKKLEIQPIKVRSYNEEAIIDEVSFLENNTIVYLTTKEDEEEIKSNIKRGAGNSRNVNVENRSMKWNTNCLSLLKDLERTGKLEKEKARKLMKLALDSNEKLKFFYESFSDNEEEFLFHLDLLD